jgi:hypothetical protein
MADERQSPPSAQHDRIEDRPYESDFAKLPADETHAHEPGGGPAGSGTAGTPNTPLILVGVGFAVIFVAFGVDHWAPVALGVLLILVGGIWGGVRSRQPRVSGVGTVTSGGSVAASSRPEAGDPDPAADREPAGRDSATAGDDPAGREH